MTIDFSKVGKGEIEVTLPTVADVLDVEAAKGAFKKYIEACGAAVGKMRAFEIKTDQDLTEITDMVGQCNRLIRQMEAARKAKIEQPNDFVRTVNGFVKQFRDKLEQAKNLGKKKISDYGYMLEMQRRKEQKKAEEAAAAKQAEIDKAAKKHGIKPVQMPAAPKQTAPPRVKTERASASIKMVWTYEISTMDQIPRQYLRVDDRAIKRAIDGGVRDIPGIRIYETSKAHVVGR